MGQRIEFKIEQHLRPQHADSKRTLMQKFLGDQSGAGKRRQQKRISPDRKSGHDSRYCAARGCAPPKHSAEKSGRELSDGREG
ncbi:hypothetical protein MnTg02_00641 [bacterium MnTg02]|nr:hypothetical protein MnTg02_00641 [bacterium MnTg02]